MTARIDLVSGFLGAGKTTFIRRYGEWLGARGIPHVVVENEFGVANVDSAMLKSDGARVVELSGGCICCGLKRDFRILLAELGRQDVRIVVEPSGIFNPHDFFDVVLDPSLDGGCAPGAAVTIVDPHMLDDADGDSLEIMREQMRCAGRVVLSKTGGAGEERIADWSAAARRLAGDDALRLETKPWELFTDADFSRLFGAPDAVPARRGRLWNHAAMYEAALVFGVCDFTDAEVARCVELAFAGGGSGGVIRIKGYLKAGGGGYHEVNCTARDRSVRHVDFKARPFLTVIGRSLDRKRLAEFFKNARVG